MIHTKLSETKYRIEVWDWIYTHDDYTCGYVMRFPLADEESDLRYWMFYHEGTKPLSYGDMIRISDFIGKLNRNLD